MSTTYTYEKVGRMEKLGYIVKNWRERIFSVSLTRRTLCYFRTESDYKKHISTGASSYVTQLSMPNYYIYLTDYMDRELCLELCHRQQGERHYFLSFKNLTEMQEWIDIFVEGGMVLMGTHYPQVLRYPRGSTGGADEHHQALTLSAPVQLGKFGFLQKRGAWNTSYRTRFCRTEFPPAGPCVYYYGTVETSSPNGFINLVNATVGEDMNAADDMSFWVDDGSRKYFLRAPSKTQKRRWMEVLKWLASGVRDAPELAGHAAPVEKKQDGQVARSSNGVHTPQPAAAQTPAAKPTVSTAAAPAASSAAPSAAPTPTPSGASTPSEKKKPRVMARGAGSIFGGSKKPAEQKQAEEKEPSQKQEKDKEKEKEKVVENVADADDDDERELKKRAEEFKREEEQAEAAAPTPPNKSSKHTDSPTTSAAVSPAATTPAHQDNHKNTPHASTAAATSHSTPSQPQPSSRRHSPSHSRSPSRSATPPPPSGGRKSAAVDWEELRRRAEQEEEEEEERVASPKSTNKASAQPPASLASAFQTCADGTVMTKLPTSSLASPKPAAFYLSSVDSRRGKVLLQRAVKEQGGKVKKGETDFATIEHGYLLSWDSSKSSVVDSVLYLGKSSDWQVFFDQDHGMFGKKSHKALDEWATQSFSIVTAKRSVDVVVKKREEFEQWKAALTYLSTH